MGNWYNGYSPKERHAKGRAIAQLMRDGKLPEAPPGPCALCGDPEATLELHSEDYSQPFLFEPPAAYALCYVCHRIKLHKRFFNRADWEAYKAHVRRGGYARDLKDPKVQAELKTLKRAMKNGERLELRTLRPVKSAAAAWWERLACDKSTLKAASARPRP